MNDATATPVRPAASTHAPRLAWPPPGLESMQGDAWKVITEFAIGVGLLALPLLVGIATPQPFWSLGAFGQSWWVPMLTTLLAFGILLSASWRLSRLLRSAAAASRLGYGIGTVAVVATDQAKDSGFVLQGARHYASLLPNERRALLAMRVTSAVCYLAACLWIPLGLAGSLFIAATASFGNDAVWLVTLLPAAALVVIATMARILEHLSVRRHRKMTNALVDADVHREANEWTENLALVGDDAALAHRVIMKPRALAFAAFAVLVPAVLLLVPVTAVITSAAMGPVLVAISLPGHSKMLERFAVADALREYRLAPDSSITPMAAGIAFSNLSGIGGVNHGDPLIRKPVVNYPEWTGLMSSQDLMLEVGSGKMFAEVANGLSAERRDYLAMVASHPMHAEYATLGRALRADIFGARMNFPLPDTLMAYSMPLPRFGRVRESAYLHVGKAAYEFSQGRNDDAERTLKEVISAGLLMMDEGTFMIETLIGSVIMGIGTQGLQEFYRASGRAAEGDAIASKRAIAERAASLARLVDPRATTGSSLEAMTQTAANPDAPRGLRWEYYMMFNNVASCINLQNVVYGPGQDYDAWVAKTRSTLVRYPGDAELFNVASAGLLGTRAKPTTRCLPSGKLIRLLKNF